VQLPADFKALLSSIEPTETHVSHAKAAHEKVRDQLRMDAEFGEAHQDTFLSGSYARHTAINDINDVDVICLIDIDQSITEPHRVLAWTQSVLNKYYSTTKLQGRSIGLQAAHGVWVDLVPAAPMNGNDQPLWIPDREAKVWVATHPKGQIRAATDKNKTTDGYYVQVVKLLKFWRDRLPEPSRPKSYLLETLVHRSIGLPSSHALAVVSVLESIQSNHAGYRGTDLVPTILDPGYSIVNVAKHWEAKNFDAFMTQVISAAGSARRAIDSDNEAESRKLWRQLFGPLFGQ
jgi:hypothetical protein